MVEDWWEDKDVEMSNEDSNTYNPRGQKRPKDGRGRGKGVPGGRRAGRNKGGCKDNGPGRGKGEGRSSGRNRQG